MGCTAVHSGHSELGRVSVSLVGPNSFTAAQAEFSVRVSLLVVGTTTDLRIAEMEALISWVGGISRGWKGLHQAAPSQQ